MELYQYLPFIYVGSILSVFMTNIFFRTNKTPRETPIKVISYHLSKTSENPYWGDEKKLTLYDHDNRECLTFDLAQDSQKDLKAIKKYLDFHRKKHGRVLLITYDEYNANHDLAFKYALKDVMGFPNREYLFMNIKTLYYYVNNDVGRLSILEEVLAESDLDVNAPLVYNFVQLFEILCDELECSITSKQDIMNLYNNIMGY